MSALDARHSSKDLIDQGHNYNMTKKQKIKSVIISLIVIANDNQLVKKSIYIKIEKLKKSLQQYV